MMILCITTDLTKIHEAQLAGVVEYAVCIFREG